MQTYSDDAAHMYKLSGSLFGTTLRQEHTYASLCWLSGLQTPSSASRTWSQHQRVGNSPDTTFSAATPHALGHREAQPR